MVVGKLASKGFVIFFYLFLASILTTRFMLGLMGSLIGGAIYETDG